MDPFVSWNWLAEHRADVVLADVRFYLDGRSPRSAYEQGHLPGAVYIDVESVLSDARPDASTGRHPLPNPAKFAAGLGAAGIGDGDPVVAYDDAGGVIAARLVWMLRAIGHPAALLEGGPQGELERGPGQARAARTFTAVPWPADRLVTIEEVAEISATGSAALIDARPRERFDGEPDGVDPRAGHIPGALSFPAREEVDFDGLPDDVVSYCGSGVTACFNLLRLERAGRSGRLYPGSWSEWSRDPSRPVG
jgi:thiosulfate/3-mercaptopyruvate sulfurtransferase